MLLRFLAVTAMCLGASALPNTPDSHVIRLPCAPCSFADLTCSQDKKPNAYLVRKPRPLPFMLLLTIQTIEFAMENGTLFANHQSIFPVSTPMQFPAVRHWGSKTSSETEDVVLEYAMNVQQFPPHVDAVLGDVYRLSMRLLDLHGRPATPNLVTIGIVRNAEAKLLISHIQLESESAAAAAQRHGSLRGGYKSWKMKYWKTQLGAYFVTVKEAVKGSLPNSSFKSRPAGSDVILDNHHKSEQELDSKPDHTRFGILSFYQFNYASPHDGHRHFFRLVRPIILPAFLGILAGFVACVIGFGLGRIVASVYFHAQGQRDPVESEEDEEDEEEQVSEKQRLMAIFSEA